jgi:hypothetical protein
MAVFLALCCLAVSAACIGRCNRVARVQPGDAVASAIAGFLFLAAGFLWTGNALSF